MERELTKIAGETMSLARSSRAQHDSSHQNEHSNIIEQRNCAATAEATLGVSTERALERRSSVFFLFLSSSNFESKKQN